jgi:hypothetical protein
MSTRASTGKPSTQSTSSQPHQRARNSANTAPRSTFRSPLPHPLRQQVSAGSLSDHLIRYVCAVRCAPSLTHTLWTAAPTLCAQLHRPEQRSAHTTTQTRRRGFDTNTNTIPMHTSCLQYRDHIARPSQSDVAHGVGKSQFIGAVPPC